MSILLARKLLGGAQAPADVSTLITALGGNAVVPAFYDGRAGVTSAAGNVTAWADARGAGFGPTLTVQASATSPTISGRTLSFTGPSNMILASSTQAALNVTQALTLVVIGACAGQTGAGYMAALQGSPANDGVYLFTSGAGGGAMSAQYNQAGVAIQPVFPVVASSATVRTWLVGKSATTGTLIQCPAQASTGALSQAASPTTATATIACGGLNVNGFSATGTVTAMFVLTRQFTAGDKTTIDTWSVANALSVDA